MSYKRGLLTERSNRTLELLAYIEWCESRGRPATRQDFILAQLGRLVNPIAARGYLSAFFSAVQRCEIVVKERRGGTFIYKMGPNAAKFLNGEV
jgi:hypothetical protein